MTAPVSWGRAHRFAHTLIDVRDTRAVAEQLARLVGGKRLALPFGSGRSYGDSCLNQDGLLLHSKRLDCFIEFDRARGVLCAESGLSLAEILTHVVPYGWFLPVVPGTKYVTLGGALANDIHGKNHHRAGSFANHVHRFGLLRSDSGREIVCSRTDNSELFRATVGGLGLTGFITWIELSLSPMPGSSLAVENILFRSISEFLEVSDSSATDFEFSVAWFDCLRFHHGQTRGIFSRANFAHGSGRKLHAPPKAWKRLPISIPSWLLNSAIVKAFNTVYFALQNRERGRRSQHYDGFFFPLDQIGDWNKAYGRGGLYQYQCVIPSQSRQAGLEALMQTIVGAGQGSFLAVLKVFGESPSAGLLSFPRAGATLALDFPNRGQRTLDLMTALDEIVLRFGGRVYPAKDGRLSSVAFKSMYPLWQEFQAHIDPALSSSFWRRVTS